MNKPVFENQRELNCKKTIVILSIISLICEVLSFIPYFVACYWVDGKVYYQLVQLRPLQILCKPPVWYRIEKSCRRKSYAKVQGQSGRTGGK